MKLDDLEEVNKLSAMLGMLQSTEHYLKNCPDERVEVSLYMGRVDTSRPSKFPVDREVLLTVVENEVDTVKLKLKKLGVKFAKPEAVKK